MNAAQPRQDADVDIAPRSTTPSEHDDTLVRVEGYSVFGNTFLSEQDITNTLAPFTGGDFRVDQIHDAANSLRQRYIDAGLFAAEVVIPPQALGNDHIVALYVYEGLLAEQGVFLINSGDRVRDDTISAILANNLTGGDHLQRSHVERAILLSGDLPGIGVNASILPGQRDGEAIFQLETVDEQAVHGAVYADNFGNYYTGEARIGATVYIDSPTKRGDRITLDAITSGDRSGYVFAQYDAPVGGSGLRLGASLDHLRYRLGEEFRNDGLEGNATEARLFASYPVIRASQYNLYTRVQAGSLDLRDRNDASGRSDRRVHQLTVGVAGDMETRIVKPGELIFGIDLSGGQLDILGGIAFQDFDDQFQQAEGGFARAGYGVSYLQHLSGRLSAFLSVTGQFASQNLDTSQKFFIGGPYDVAGYPISEASGDEGMLVHADLRYDLPEGFLHSDTQLSVFYAHGRARIYKDTWAGWQGTNTRIRNTIELASVGLSSHSMWRDKYVLQLMVGRQLGQNLASDPVTLEDSDRSDDDYRGWIQAEYLF